GILIVTSEVDELEVRVGAEVVERRPGLGIDMCREGFGRGLDRLVEYFPALSPPALEEDVKQVYIGAAEVLQDPGQHSGVLPVGRVVEHRRHLLTQTGSSNPASEGVG